MTEKRFGIIKTKTYGLYVPVDKMKVYNFSSFESELDCIRVVNALNDLEEKSRENGKIASKYLEENEQLKKELEDALLDVKIYKNANVTFDNVYQENNKLKSRIEYLERKIQRERTSAMKEHEKWEKEIQKENEQLKQENSVFEGKDAKHYQRWVNQIKKYVGETNTDFTYDDDFIIKIALSYTLQSLRNGESLKRFQWDYKELKE